MRGTPGNKGIVVMVRLPINPDQLRPKLTLNELVTGTDNVEKDNDEVGELLGAQEGVEVQR